MKIEQQKEAISKTKMALSIERPHYSQINMPEIGGREQTDQIQECQKNQLQRIRSLNKKINYEANNKMDDYVLFKNKLSVDDK